MKLVLHCIATAFVLSFAALAAAQMIAVPQTFWRLAAQEDTDNDQKITVHDRTTPFEIRDASGANVHAVTNVYQLSVLLQELKSADDRHMPEISLHDLRLEEDIVDRTHRLVKNVYWDTLTRRIDADHVVHDSKVVSKDDYIYVPGADPNAARKSSFANAIGDIKIFVAILKM